MTSKPAPELAIPGPHGLPPPESVWWPKKVEEAWAKKANFPTKLAGWVVISAFIPPLVGTFSSDVYDAVDSIDILSLIAGIHILGGRQSWLRFATFNSVAATISAVIVMGSGMIFDTPACGPTSGVTFSLNTGDSWINWLSAIGMTGFQAAACVLTLRTRKLIFWTPIAKFWGRIGTVLLLAVPVTSFAALCRDAAAPAA